MALGRGVPGSEEAPAGALGPARRPPLDVWAIRLEADERSRRRGASWLSSDELDRARRFRFDRDRDRFVLARAGLRVLLGQCVGASPSALRFSYGPHGKPALAWPAASLSFNLAHSRDLAVYAVGGADPVGIDVEYLTPARELEAVARQFFAPEEHANLMTVPTADRLRAFFSCWTRKEAYLKALGHGVGARLDRFAVAFEPGERARLRHIEGDPDEARRWSMFAFEPDPGAVAALAVPYPGATWRCQGPWRFTEFLERQGAVEGCG